MRSRVRLLALLAATCLLTACASSSSASWQLEDRLEAVDGTTWVVGSHLVTVAADASVVGKPSVGSTVRIGGRRSNRGELVADSVEVTDGQPAATAAPQRAAPTPNPPAPPARTKKGGREGED